MYHLNARPTECLGKGHEEKHASRAQHSDMLGLIGAGMGECSG
jgi:hypothetical protein